MDTMAPVGNAKSRTGITPCGLIRDCWFPSCVAVLISGEERKGSGLLRKDSAGRSAPAQVRPRCLPQKTTTSAAKALRALQV